MPEEIEVPTEHLHEEMEERAHHGGGWMARVAVSSALLAVCAAVSALLAGHYANDAMLEEMKATDQWALFQAKGIKASVIQTKVELLEGLGKPAAAGDRAKATKYEDEQKEIKDEADKLEHESSAHMEKHNAFAHAVTIFQIAIALGAISVLAKRPKLWFFSLGAGAVGLVFLVQGLL